MSTVVCKLVVTSSAVCSYGKREVSFIPVYEQDGINKEWCDATPCGNINLQVDPKITPAFELLKTPNYPGELGTKVFAFFVPEDELSGDFKELVDLLEAKMLAKKEANAKVTTSPSQG